MTTNLTRNAWVRVRVGAVVCREAATTLLRHPAWLRRCAPQITAPSLFAVCLALLIAAVASPGCSRGRQDAASEETGHHPALVRTYLKLRDGHTVELNDGAAVRSVREVTTVRSDRPTKWETAGGPAVLSAGGAALAPEGYLLMEDVLVERTGQIETYLSPPLETVVMTIAAMSGRCEVAGDSIHIKLFHVTLQTAYSVGTPREREVVGSLPETVFVIDLADFEQ